MEKLYFDLTSQSLDKMYELATKVSSEKDGVCIIAFDGMGGSGKRTIAHKLRKKLGDDCKVIHIEDYYIPNEDRTEEELKKTAGLFDIERFKNEIINGIKSKKPFFMSKYDSKKGAYLDAELIRPYKIYIFEGAFSLHRELADMYDLKVFFSVSTELQRERLLRRNGADAFEDFISQRLPVENKYFEAWNIPESCDYMVCVD